MLLSAAGGAYWPLATSLDPPPSAGGSTHRPLTPLCPPFPPSPSLPPHTPFFSLGTWCQQSPPDCPYSTALCRAHTEEGQGLRCWPGVSPWTPPNRRRGAFLKEPNQKSDDWHSGLGPVSTHEDKGRPRAGRRRHVAVTDWPTPVAPTTRVLRLRGRQVARRYPNPRLPQSVPVGAGP